MSTKKVGITGNLGSRCGVRIRKRLKAVSRPKASKCPDCLKTSVKRAGAGVWECKKCGLKFAGRAYRP